MERITNGLSQGDFTLLNVLHNGSMQNIITLICSLGDGNVDSANAPLSISGGALSIDLSSYTNTSGLTMLLAGKVDDSQVLTNIPAGALFTDTVYTHPSSHPISMITGLQTALNGKQTSLTTGAGCFLNGSAISSYTL